MIISQEEILAILLTIPLSTIKMQMGRIRLKFTRQELAKLLFMLNEAQSRKVTFKHIWHKNKEDKTYQNLCKNFDVVAKLMPLIFSKFNEMHKIKASRMYNVLDTTLIPTKRSQSITDKDFKVGDVTIRNVEKIRHYISGLKLFALMNRERFIFKAAALNINTPDIDAVKNPFYYSIPKGILLADKAFNSQMVRDRLKGYGTRLISPFKANQKQQLTDKEKEFYKRRWEIESAFQKLKAEYGNFKLGASSRYTLIKQKAALLLAALNYNAALIKR